MKRWGKMISLSILWVFVASCSVETPQDGGPGISNGADRAIVTFSVRAPGLSRGGATRAFPDGYEEEIDDITVFLAHDNGGGFFMDSMVIVDRFRAVSATTQAFTLELPTSSVPTKIFAVANLMDADNGLAQTYSAGFTAACGKGAHEDDFVGLLADDWAGVGADASGTGAVCMYMSGSVVLPTIEKGETNLHIPLLRWLARADVQIDPAVDSKSFVPSSATLWHGYRQASVMAGAAAYDTGNSARVLSPTLPSVDRLDPDDSIAIPMTGVSGIVATTYVGEHDGKTSYDDKLDAPCIVLGGYFDGSATESFYRIDFNSGLDGHPFGQVLRNWNYIFNVTKVMSAGYDTPGEAAANPAHSIVIEVQMWDENVQQIDFVGSGDYMYVNTLDVLLNYGQSARDTFTVRSTLPFTWGLDETITSDSTSDAPLTDDKYAVSIIARDTTNTTYTDYTFSVTTLTENTSNVRNESAVFITARNATMSVRLTQKAESVSERVINVLSLTDDLGSLGIYFENGKNNTGTTELRTILNDKTWFGPTGVVKCGGFTFDRFYAGDINPTTTVSLDELQRALDSTDILVTCYTDNPPQEVVDMILEWNQKPYHVLFVVADSGGTVNGINNGTPTNVLMRQSLKESSFFDNRLTWYNVSQLGALGTVGSSDNPDLNAALGADYLTKLYNDGDGSLVSGEPIHVAPDSFVMADQTDENLTFMAGPFGLPDQGMASMSSTYQIWDGIAEFAVPSAGSPVIPLLVLRADIFGYNSYAAVKAKTDAMMIGVDIAHTTVYLGESQHTTLFLNTAPPSGFTPGLANSPYYNSVSVLMSNIWGWAVQNVLAQVEEDD